MSTIGTIGEISRTGARTNRAAQLIGVRLYGLLLILVLLSLWELSARLGWVVSAYWPPVTAILRAAVGELAGGDMLDALASTLRRAAIGYIVGSVVGVVLGILLGKSRVLRLALLPLIEIIRPIPTPAVIPPLILFLGVDDALKIFIVSLASFFPVFTNTISGVAAIDDTLIQTARTFRIGWLRTLVSVVLPATLPAVTAGLRTATSLTLVVAVLAEMIAGSSGMGYYLVQMQYALRPDLMYAAVLYLAIVGYCLNRAFIVLEARFVPWIGKT
ncbi:ABC transporter permease [Bradyrhizobium tropiciagri]|uniref:ABC transporter permease n=1 Tax=Bradyrhizobium tropiciagri TaxID=312253 RepID=UPI001BA62E95|nr:ABC transporter permease [Bradyrhizobium tropiciagri]MBR0873208.1 ABC transporter permease [Bradyrhizobium tropiciagri]